MSFTLRTKHLLAGGLIAAVLFIAYTSRNWGSGNSGWSRPQNEIGSYNGIVPDVQDAVVPVVLADGRVARLLVPARQPNSLIYRDQPGIYPVVLNDSTANREQLVRPRPARVEPVAARRAVATPAKKRSWEKEVLIVAGSAGAGTAIGAVAGGKKGAAVGAVTGGVAGLIYDLATRR